jgi:tetratricopeptide (TPR) repeat protein
MRTRNILLVGLSIFLLQPLRAQDPAELTSAIKPLDEGVPEVAIARLRALLENRSGDEWRAGAEKLVEALLAANRPREALALLDDTRLRETRSTKFWRAQALAGLKRWKEAQPFYEEVAADANSPLRAEAIFGTAETLRALGRLDEAQQKLALLFRDKQWSIRARLHSAELYLDKQDPLNARRLLDDVRPATSADRKTRRFLLGRVEMVQHHPERAILIFESLLKRPAGATHEIAVATLFEVAEAHLQLKTPEAGDDFVEDFIEHHPMDVDLAPIFAKLDELYRAERKPARAELERWTHEPEQPRRAFAQWYLARIELRAGRRERALPLFAELRKTHPNTPAIAAALLDFAQLQLEDRRFDDALAVLNEARSLAPEPALLDRINLLSAEVQYRAKRFEQAAVAFEQIAHSGSPSAKMSIFNASLGWLQVGNSARFAVNYDELGKQGGDEEARAQLHLEEGLLQAAKGDNNAAASLKNFVREFPHNARASEAWVALAEIAFHAQPPRLDEARKNLARAAESKPTAAAVERGEYLTIWIEEASGADDSKVIELTNRFLQDHAASALAPDVRMKLAEAYYRRQDFANAQTQFEILTQQNPNGPFAEKALFFVAASAMSSMGQQSLDHAIVLFDQVVQRKGELRWAARNEQAIIERKLGKPQDALVMYDEVLKNDAKPSEKREALCGKGDIYFELAASDPKSYERAVEAYEQLAHDAHDIGYWRNQALFKKGVCLEKKEDRGGALSTFYQVLDTPARPDRAPELFWFYKAGFNAARLLEDDANWNSAANIYQKLVAAGGPRAEEAKARLNRLRLEHFLWEE